MEENKTNQKAAKVALWIIGIFVAFILLVALASCSADKTPTLTEEEMSELEWSFGYDAAMYINIVNNAISTIDDKLKEENPDVLAVYNDVNRLYGVVFDLKVTDDEDDMKLYKSFYANKLEELDAYRNDVFLWISYMKDYLNNNKLDTLSNAQRKAADIYAKRDDITAKYKIDEYIK